MLADVKGASMAAGIAPRGFLAGMMSMVSTGCSAGNGIEQMGGWAPGARRSIEKRVFQWVAKLTNSGACFDWWPASPTAISFTALRGRPARCVGFDLP